MKICHIHPYQSPPKGSMGAERVIESVVRGTLSLGYEVCVKIHPDSKNPPAKLVSEVPDDVDIVHFHQWEPDRIDYNKFNKPWVVSLYAGGVNTDPTWLACTHENSHIICVSNFISNRLKCPAYVWTSSEVKDFIYESNKGDYFLWMAGTDWGEGKGIFSTIVLAKKMRFKLKIAGTGKDKNMIERIKSLCIDNIEFVGEVNGTEKAKLLARAKGFLLPTKLPDACPTTFGEAMLSGTPVIGSSNGAMPELLSNKKVGFICKTETDFAKAVLNIKKINPKDCREYGLKNFTGEVAAKKYVQYYQNMLDFGRVTI